MGVYHNGSLVNLKAIIKENDFFTIADFSFFYKKDYLYTQAREDLITKKIPCVDSVKKEHYPKFNRNTRVKIVLDDEKIEILDPPALPEKPKNKILLKLRI